MKLDLQYPLQLSCISMPKSIHVDDEFPIAIKILNKSSIDYGSKAENQRKIIVRINIEEKYRLFFIFINKEGKE